MPQDAPPPLPGDRPPAPPKAPPTGRLFPCAKCGARLDFDPSSRALKCPYCGHVETIAPSEAAVVERDFDEYLSKQAKGRLGTIQGRSSQVRCPGCGAVVLLEDKVATDRCPFCATYLKNEPEAAQAMIAPESLLPFAVDVRKARAAFQAWVNGLWFAPTGLKVLANLGQLNGVYVPYWTYDAMTYTHYRGRRGDNYQATETYTEYEDGRPVTRTRTVILTRWTAVAGEVQHFFDDVLVCASRSLPGPLARKLEPWDLRKLEGFRPEYLSGFRTERYAVGLAEGFDRARGVMDGEIRELCRRDIGGDYQELHEVRTQYVGVTFKHLLLPVWVASYRYQDRVFRILVNARSGHVSGERPWSWAKIVSLILAALAALALAWYLVARFQQ
jgi:DNA-directed RNA polymerase subunit RPC12/RpoP